RYSRIAFAAWARLLRRFDKNALRPVAAKQPRRSDCRRFCTTAGKSGVLDKLEHRYTINLPRSIARANRVADASKKHGDLHAAGQAGMRECQRLS
ncbi:MAG: hypothetical protein WBD95_10865, partial [Xanthobacteraceae bacterium]